MSESRMQNMSWQKVLRKVAFAKVPFYALIILLIVILTVFMMLIYDSHCDNKIHATRFGLNPIRFWMSVFKADNGSYPDSIAELRKYVRHNYEDESLDQLFIDFQGNKKDHVPEFDILNGKGGYYYNKTTGVVKINLTKPVKHYLKFYCGERRDQIPSDW